MTAARRGIPTELWTATFVLCILWVAGVPKVSGWVVAAPIGLSLAVGLTAVIAARAGCWLLSTAAIIHYRLPGRQHSRWAKERGIV